MTTIRTARTFGIWRHRRQRKAKQPGLIARLRIAIGLLWRGHSWQFAWSEACKVIK